MYNLRNYFLFLKIFYLFMFLNNIGCELNVFSIGDWGENTACFNNITKTMKSLSKRMNPEFIISAGDNFYPNGVSSVDDDKWDELLENPFSMFQNSLKIHSCLGDHDWRGNTYSQILRTNHEDNNRWHLPGYWWYEIKTFNVQNGISSLIKTHFIDDIKHNIIQNNSDENKNVETILVDDDLLNYENESIDEFIDNLNTALNVNNTLGSNLSFKTLISEYLSDNYTSSENVTAIFIYLDSYLLSQDPFKKTSNSYRELQLEFLEKTLKASVYNNIDWITIVTHYSIFSSGYHGPQKNVSKYLLPFIEKYRVDYIISGHDHHSEFLRYEDINTNFYIVGATSKPRRGFAKTHNYSIFKTDSCSFTAFTFSKDIAAASIIGFNSFYSTSFKKSNKYIRKSMKAEPTEFPDNCSNIKINKLFNILGWTLSISIYS
ncbi:hypothetical protein FG386_001919 [Cryptosporidium ryanae]|uniref:uncharacterized protein n=1 Tax=Cryptosporidium ryanae TaxID=515981 RepID=UPI003519DE64|nr:hypothetical protein FG386_001919 [Cryptosporidium ryanae]